MKITSYENYEIFVSLSLNAYLSTMEKEKTPVLKPKLSSIQNHTAKFDSRYVSSDTRNRPFTTTRNGSMTKNDMNSIVEMDNEESPVHIACTQDGTENIDVVWDWNSPQAKKHPKKCQKRLHLPQSPKIPLKKFPSNNSIQNFEKLREELQALRKEIALPENEDSLQLSPREEADYKNIHNSPVNLFLDDFNDECFDDMFDEKVIEFSEKAETHSTVSPLSPNIGITKSKKIHLGKNIHEVNSAKQISFRKTRSETHINVANDSFESLLGDIDVEKLTCPSTEENNYLNSVKTAPHKTRPIKSTDPSKIQNNVLHTNSGKVEFHRTQSFELTNLELSADLPRCKLDEIEKKRREARAKLEMKRKHDQTISSSPSQCSREEIESKRLQALTKLENKRQQDIIERKRQEALKRLQTNRKKNARIVKSSLTDRLD